MSQFIELNLEKIDHNHTVLQIIWAYGQKSRQLSLPSYLTLSFRALRKPPWRRPPLGRSPDQGTDETEAAGASPATTNQTDQPIRSTSPKILLVEHNSALRNIFTELLQAEKYDLTAVCNGPECMQTVRTFQPTLILTGLRMPVMDGFEMIESLRNDPLTAKTPIIVLTAWSDSKSRARAFAAGANDYLSLPVDTKRLFWKINKYLSNSQ